MGSGKQGLFSFLTVQGHYVRVFPMDDLKTKKKMVSVVPGGQKLLSKNRTNMTKKTLIREKFGND